jgi:hypothetical protein
LYYSCDLEAQKNRWKQKKSLSFVLSEIIAGDEICPKCGMRQGNILLNDAQLKKKWGAWSRSILQPDPESLRLLA